jgi:hypothetical protein
LHEQGTEQVQASESAPVIFQVLAVVAASDTGASLDEPVVAGALAVFKRAILFLAMK